MVKSVGGNLIGFRLLEMRSWAQKNNLELNEILELKNKMQNNWEHLKKLAQNCTFQSQRNDILRPGKKQSIDESSYAPPQHSKKQRLSKVLLPPNMHRPSRTKPIPKNQQQLKKKHASKPVSKKKQGKRKRLTKMPQSYCA